MKIYKIYYGQEIFVEYPCVLITQGVYTALGGTFFSLLDGEDLSDRDPQEFVIFAGFIHYKRDNCICCSQEGYITTAMSSKQNI